MKIKLTLIYYTLTLALYADTLISNNGQQSTTQILSINQQTLLTEKGENIDLSKLRSVSFEFPYSPTHRNQDKELLKEALSQINKIDRKPDPILKKTQIFTFNKNGFWTEEYTTLYWVTKQNSWELCSEVELNSNYEQIKNISILYTTPTGAVESFPKSSISIISSSKENPQLKKLKIEIPHLPYDSVIMIRTSKEQVAPRPVHQSSLTCQLASDKPITHSELILRLDEKYKEFEIKAKLSDPQKSIDYDLVKTTNYISRRWKVNHLSTTPFSITLTTNQRPLTKQINIYDENLRKKIQLIITSTIVQEWNELKDITQLLEHLKEEFKIIPSNPSLKVKPFNELIASKSGTIEDLTPLILAILELNHLKPELYRMRSTKSSLVKNVIKVDQEIYDLNPEFDSTLDWSGYCYYGYNLGVKLSLDPQTRIKELRKISLSLYLNSQEKESELTLTLNQPLTTAEKTMIQEFIGDASFEENETQTNIRLQQQVQWINSSLVSFRIPTLQNVFGNHEKNQAISIKVVIPKNWLVHHLPNDQNDIATYTPSEEGFVIETFLKTKTTAYQMPIILEKKASDKYWFE
jgi:hypothetical protein